jgi:hypothetical protein
VAGLGAKVAILLVALVIRVPSVGVDGSDEADPATA